VESGIGGGDAHDAPCGCHAVFVQAGDGVEVVVHGSRALRGGHAVRISLLRKEFRLL